MAILASIGTTSFGTGNADLPFTVAADATQIKITLTHSDWPEGECIRAEIFWDGVSSGVFSTSGGVIRDKAGNPTGGTVGTTRVCSKPTGLTSGMARVSVMQPITTAVLVEAF